MTASKPSWGGGEVGIGLVELDAQLVVLSAGGDGQPGAGVVVEQRRTRPRPRSRSATWSRRRRWSRLKWRGSALSEQAP